MNAAGTSEILESVFEERLVNALVHHDYLVSVPIRLFIFDNRIEIVSLVERARTELVKGGRLKFVGPKKRWPLGG